jgi:hypothetical protein
MYSSADTVEEYLASLPTDRRQLVATLRALIKKHLPKGYKEGMQYGMISYHIPLEDFPDTYNGQPLGYIALASQKNYVSLYLMGIYSEPDAEDALHDKFVRAGKRLDMGKSCIRVKKIDDLPLDVVAEAIELLTPAQFIASYKKHRPK